MKPVVAANGPVVSIIFASNRPHNVSMFLFSINEMCEDPSRFEVLIKIDDGDDHMKHILDMAIEEYPFVIRYMQTPRLDGYYSLHKGYQRLLDECADPRSYFIYVINDELRFTTKGWDRVLMRYIGYFPDDVFRLKLSVHKHFNYYGYYECGPCPENYPIMTRRWMELVEGVGDCWGPDGWHQYIDYHLGAIRFMPGLFRSVAIDDILLGGETAGLELTKEQSQRRTYRIYQEWWRMYSVEKQRELRRLATKLHVYVWAHENKLQEKGFVICEDKRTQFFTIRDLGTNKVAYMFSYRMSGLVIRLHNFALLLRCFQGRWGSYPLSIWTYVRSSAEPKIFPLQYVNRFVCLLAVILAAVISPFTPHFGVMHGPPGLRVRMKAVHFGYSMYALFYWFRDWMNSCDKWMTLEGYYRQFALTRLAALDDASKKNIDVLHRFSAQKPLEKDGDPIKKTA